MNHSRFLCLNGFRWLLVCLKRCLFCWFNQKVVPTLFLWEKKFDFTQFVDRLIVLTCLYALFCNYYYNNCSFSLVVYVMINNRLLTSIKWEIKEWKRNEYMKGGGEEKKKVAPFELFFAFVEWIVLFCFISLRARCCSTWFNMSVSVWLHFNSFLLTNCLVYYSYKSKTKWNKWKQQNNETAHTAAILLVIMTSFLEFELF